MSRLRQFFLQKGVVHVVPNNIREWEDRQDRVEMNGNEEMEEDDELTNK